MTDSDSNERNIMTVKKKEWTSKKKTSEPVKK